MKHTTVVYCILAWTSSLALAGQINQLPNGDPGTQAKIHRYSSKMNVMEQDMGRKDHVGCNQNVGNVDVSKGGGGSLREMTTVIKGDVVNICK